MTACTHFQWHSDARLFEGDRAVQCTPTGETGPVVLPTGAVADLGKTIRDRRPFCVSDTAAAGRMLLRDGMFITQSGGSSGAPKLIRRTQASWIASFAANARLFAIGPGDRVAVLGGLGHSLALYGMLEALHLGADAQVLAGLHPGKQNTCMAEAGTTVLYATPTQLRMLMMPERPLPSLRLILCGGGALDAATQEAVRENFPNAAPHCFYGAAETSFITLSGPDTPQGSVGRAYPGVDLRILGSDARPTTDTGTVWARSAYLCEGYADGRTLCQRDGFVSAGEIGRLDGDGYLWLMGRRDRMVTVGEQNVYPETVEALLSAQPSVDACAVLPRPDAQRGHHLVAVIRAAHPLDSGPLREVCRTTLGAAMTPKRVLQHPDFPVLASGKPDLIALAEWLEAQG